ncbi:EamA family transporter [Flexivirga oryzae]|uniref:Drug/metabolite transporter (DMT)-like permease n=1 Tax=Flexivirga oryzae TaxID=1794944 RepID=A0A839NAF5_9MICO|nr:EamA family transporter [Flexivirga oryzae]MBB2894207.1 drug/metabolite transporter (DMT)-like permease [Flexivirga oryzae]MBB2894689.1 drug/metabolite transporter (DMT)-like permease [Flexivirga oryzae]
MSATALSLVLTAAVLHAVWNIAAKRVGGGSYAFVFSYSLLSALLWSPLGIAVLLVSGDGLTRTLLLASLLSGALHIVYGLTLQTGYRKADLSVVYPVARGTGPLITMLFAIVVLADRPGAVAVAGGFVIVAGVAVVASARSADAPQLHAAPAWRGVRWGAATGLAIAAYTLWDDHAMTHLALLPIPYFWLGTAWQAGLMVPGLRGRRAELRYVLRAHWRETLCVALLSPLAYVLVLQAMTTTSVALVAPARESSIVVGSLLAWKLFHEPAPARKFAGAVVVLAGIALIAV